jgi:hypothetical protein
MASTLTPRRAYSSATHLARPASAQRITALILALAHGAADLALGGHLSRDGIGHADPADLLDDPFALMTGGR